MLQRIQSLFLFLAGGASFGLFGLPFASTDENVVQSAIFGDSLYNLNDHIALIIFFALAGVLSLVAIFLFKNRPLQLKLGRFAFIANLIGLILAVVLFFQDSPTLGRMEVEDELGLFLPILSLIFILLGLRFIGKDEKLVRSSLDRLR